MRQVYFSRPANPNDEKAFKDWVQQCMAEIENASYDDLATVANDFSVSNHTKTRTLDASTGTLTDVKNVLCTFIEDLQNRGMKRSQ